MRLRRKYSRRDKRTFAIAIAKSIGCLSKDRSQLSPCLCTPVPGLVLQHPIDLGPNLLQVCLERLSIFKLPMRHRFANKRLEEGFLFEKRLKRMCKLRIWIHERGRCIRRGNLFICFRERLDRPHQHQTGPVRAKSYLERKHVLLQEQVRPRANGELDAILRTPGCTWNLADAFGDGIIRGKIVKDTLARGGGFFIRRGI